MKHITLKSIIIVSLVISMTNAMAIDDECHTLKVKDHNKHSQKIVNLYVSTLSTKELKKFKGEVCKVRQKKRGHK